MFKTRDKVFGIEKDPNLAIRVLVLSIPSSLVFLVLVALKLLSPSIAGMAYSSVIVFNLFWLFPITFEMQQLKKYIFSLSQENPEQIENWQVNEKETQDIVKAIDKMHHFWTNKAEALQAQTISDTAVLDTLPDPILMIDKKGVILGANDAAYRLLGANIKESPIDEIFTSNNFINAVSKVLNEESSAENIIFYVQPKSDSKNGVPQKLYAHVKRLPWISKGKTVAVISIYDLSKTLKIEKMQSDFVANASHELRTPLSVISGFIETLQTSAKNDKKAREEFLKIMAEQAKYMTLLIENLLSLSRIELNQDKIPEDEIIVAPIIKDTIEAMKTKAKDRDITFEANIADNLPPVVADYAQIRQLLQNLCDNAVKYGEVGGKITVTAKKCNKIPSSKSYQVAEGEAVSVAVNNHGAVINPEEIERLTERFYRMKTHKEKNINGTGLGLAIVKHILIRHRGNLKIESSEEDGTTFTFYLPVDRFNN